MNEENSQKESQFDSGNIVYAPQHLQNESVENVTVEVSQTQPGDESKLRSGLSSKIESCRDPRYSITKTGLSYGFLESKR